MGGEGRGRGRGRGPGRGGRLGRFVRTHQTYEKRRPPPTARGHAEDLDDEEDERGASGGKGRGASKGYGRGKGYGKVADRRGGFKGKGRGRLGSRLEKASAAGAVEEAADGFRRHHHLPKAHEDAVTAICITTDAVYTASRDGVLRAWLPQRTAANLLELREKLQVPLGGACWSMIHVGEWIFCGLSDGRVRGFSKGGQDVPLQGHSEGVSAMLVHERILITGSAEGTVRCWQFNQQDGRFANTHTVADLLQGQVRCLAVMSGQLWVGGATGVTVVELATLNRSVKVKLEKKVNGFLEFQAHMIVAYAEGSIYVFDSDGKVTYSQPALRAGPVVSLIGLEEGPRVLLGHARGEISSIALPEFKLRSAWRCLEMACPVRSLRSAGHDGIFIVGGESGDLQVWQRSDKWAPSPAFLPSPLAPSPATEHEWAPDGAPCSSSGHRCVAADVQAGAAGAQSTGPSQSWRCNACGRQRTGERWLCRHSQESYCFECFPQYCAGKHRDEQQREAESVEGRWVRVRKHSGMGCAVVSFRNLEHRQSLLTRFANGPLMLGGIRIDIKPHMEKRGDGSREEVKDCAFAGWKQPKEEGACKLSARTLMRHLDTLCDQFNPVIDLDDD